MPALTQFLDADAQLRASLPASAREPETLRELYRRMVETRIFDKKAVALQRSGRLDRYTACRGQEAIVAAIALSLRADDRFVAADREHTLPPLRDAGLLDVLRHWSAASARQAASPSMALARARSLAADLSPEQPSPVVLAPGDDDIVDAPLVCEALRAAPHAGLPLIFIVPRRQWRIADDVAPPASRIAAAGIIGETVDGNDVIAMHDALQRGVAAARGGRGPLLIEAITCPLRERQPLRDEQHPPRSDAELRAAWERCPIKRLKRYLESRQLWSVAEEEALLLAAGEQAAQAARVFAGGAPA
jgi:pyruvate dehydrogenase E1 component alpha subunit